jgi:hypothetical protein
MKRRDFFQSFLSEAFHWTEEARGKPQLRLADIGKLPDESLLRLVPILCEEVQIEVDDQHVCARLPKQAQSVRLFARGSTDQFTFNQINGRTPICQITLSLAEHIQCGQDEALNLVKSFVVQLIRQRVCRPANTLS